jgi:hypothetical protein
VVAVMEKRAVDVRREGYFIIQVSLHARRYPGYGMLHL